MVFSCWTLGDSLNCLSVGCLCVDLGLNVGCLSVGCLTLGGLGPERGVLGPERRVPGT